MKSNHLLIIILFWGIAANAQHTRHQIDTLKVKEDSVLVNIKEIANVYDKDDLMSETTAYLFHDTIRRPCHWWAKKYIKKKVPVYRVFKHGPTIEYFSEGKKRVSEYLFDQLINTFHYDKNNKEITLSANDSLEMGYGFIRTGSKINFTFFFPETFSK